MASPSTVISLGYGSWGSVNDVITLGYGVGVVVDYTAHYIYAISAESRLFIIPLEASETIADRTFEIPLERRIAEVAHD